MITASLRRFAPALGVVALLLVAARPAGAFVIGPTSPGKWGSPVLGTGANVTWSLMPTGTSCAAEGCSGSITALADFLPSPGFLADVNAAFAAWAAVADLTFTMVADDGAAFNAPTTSGDIRIGGHAFDGVFGILAHGYYPPINGDTAAGDIHIDVAEPWTVGAVNDGNPGTFSVFQVLAHEIGHALGLDHTAVPNSLMNPFYNESFVGLQADDIAGAIFLYGPAPVVPPAVPEPGTFVLVALGLAGIAAARRRAA